MLNTIYDYPNKMVKEFNNEFLDSSNDTAIPDLVITCMKELEAIENITILSYETITDPDEIDINEHMINVNYKKKNLDSIVIPKYKYITKNLVGEMRFKIHIKTNLNEKTITKKILIPLEDDGFYIIDSKRWKTIWQIVDASTYAQRGRITLKARMPIIIYQSKRRPVFDSEGVEYGYPQYSYALMAKNKRRNSKAKTKFINPLMIYGAKIGIRDALKFFGMGDIISFTTEAKEKDDFYRYYPLNDIYVKVDSALVDNHKLIQAFICMLTHLSNQNFPVTMLNLDDTKYWTCRVGGTEKGKDLMAYYEKGNTTIYMIERLMNDVTLEALRIPEEYKFNIYTILKWMILNFDGLIAKNNMDINNKRIRKNEYLVLSSLGKKISENINKIVEKKSNSKMNNMDTLLEIFNFNSDIIINGMRVINDLVKSDELVNDLTFLQDLNFSFKGPQSLGEASSKMIATKYRNIHPSYMGVIDINCSSNSDVGMSGSFTPFVKLEDKFFFTSEKEPCKAEYEIFKARQKYFNDTKSSVKSVSNTSKNISFEEFLKLTDVRKCFPELKYKPIEIVEKELEE